MMTAARVANVKPPVELTGTVPRDVRLTGGGLAAIIVAICFAVGALVMGIVMSIVNVRAAAERQLRERDGVVVDAEVVAIARSRGERPRRVVTYEYEFNGRRFSGRVTLRQSDDRQLERGSPLPVHVIRSAPEHRWLSGYDSTGGIPMPVIPLVMSSLLAVGGLIVWRVRRQWTLLAEGRMAHARVTGLKKINSDKHKAFRVTYEFHTISGATRTSRLDVTKAPPAVGAVIPIVYHRDKPEWSAAYPLQLVRPGRLVY